MNRNTKIGLVLMAVLLALVVTVVLLWRVRQEQATLRAAVPERPDVDERNPVLAEKINTAHRAVVENGDRAAALAELGRLYHANGYYQEAAACWEALHRHQPREPRWAYLAADAHRWRGDQVRFEQWLDETLRRAPDYAPARLQRAEIYFKTGRTAAAEAAYQQRLVLVPGDPYARLGLARLTLLRGEERPAREQVEQVVRDHPGFASAHNLYAELLAAAGDAAGARRQRWLGSEAGRHQEAPDPWLDELVAWCFDPERLQRLARVRYETQVGDRGINLARRAIELAPHDPNGYEVLGDLYLKLGDAENARLVLEEGLGQAAPGARSVQLYVHLSQALRQSRQFERAEQVAREGLAEHGAAHELYDALGVSLAERQRPVEAEAAFRQAIALKPTDPISHYHLGLALMAQDRPAEARRAVERALEVQPTFPQALTLLARVELEAGRWSQASAYLEPLYETYSGLPHVRQMKARWSQLAGQAAEERGDLAAAERIYREGLEALPDDSALNGAIGRIYLLQGRVTDAIGPLEVFHRAHADDAAAGLLLGQAYLRAGRPADARQVLEAARASAQRRGQTGLVAICDEILRQLH
jgi:tetratricopeptide (TPR) repeat protein